MRTAARAAVAAAARPWHLKAPSARSLAKRSPSAAAGPLLSPAASCCLVLESLVWPAYCGANCSNLSDPSPRSFRKPELRAPAFYFATSKSSPALPDNPEERLVQVLSSDAAGD